MIDHLSYSSINTFLECSKRWKYQYVDAIEQPTSPDLILGSAFHGTVEGKILSRYHNKPLDSERLWDETWNEQLAQNNIGNELWIEDTYDTGLSMIQSPEVSELMNNLEPLVFDGRPMVEEKISLNLDGVDVPVVGYIDIITKDGVPGDFKTSKRHWSKTKAENEIQPLFYLLALNRNKALEQYYFRHYVFLKEPPYDVQVFETHFDSGEIEFLKDMIRSVWQCIQAGSYHENPKTWLCREIFCPFYSMCRGKYGN
jgi:hypothetical protein